MLPPTTVGLNTLSDTLFRGHPDAAVDTDDLGVHIRVGHQFDDHRGQFVGATQAVWEQDRLAQLRLEGLRYFAFTVDRGIDQTGRDGVDPDPCCGEVTRHRQRHAYDAALG